MRRGTKRRMAGLIANRIGYDNEQNAYHSQCSHLTLRSRSGDRFGVTGGQRAREPSRQRPRHWPHPKSRPAGPGRLFQPGLAEFFPILSQRTRHSGNGAQCECEDSRTPLRRITRRMNQRNETGRRSNRRLFNMSEAPAWRFKHLAQQRVLTLTIVSVIPGPAQQDLVAVTSGSPGAQSRTIVHAKLRAPE
jgi:hypothetical protein